MSESWHIRNALCKNAKQKHAILSLGGALLLHVLDYTQDYYWVRKLAQIFSSHKLQPLQFFP